MQSWLQESFVSTERIVTISNTLLFIKHSNVIQMDIFKTDFFLKRFNINYVSV